MGKRIYNVFFSLHTVSGIVISVGLYIIFLAGSFSIFKDEIEVWEKGTKVENSIQNINFDTIINHLDEEYKLYGRDIELDVKTPEEITVSFGINKDSINTSKKGKEKSRFFLKTTDFFKKTAEENYGISEFLYRLHFLDPFLFPYGRYIAGFIAFFLIFAIVTGIVIHWKKIISNFYSFNPKVILKRVWTDSHTILGTVGLPFQFILGITGAFLILKVFIIGASSLAYNGDTKKMMDDVMPAYKVDKWEIASKKKHINLEKFVNDKTAYWTDFNVERIRILNYGGTNMKYVIAGKLNAKKRFVGLGRLECNAYTGGIIFEKNPNELTYGEDILESVNRLHYGDFGGVSLKIIYFILGILTCFVIISGVLIWVEVRNKKSQTLKQRLYTAKVGHVYLAICLSMFPVTALAFLYAKITNGMFDNPQNGIYWFYFTTWSILTVFYRFKRNNYFTNKNSLVLGAFFGFLVPIVNGITSGNWFWKTYAHQYEIFTIDVFWIVLSSVALLFYFKIKPKVQEQSSFSKIPIDYKNIKEQLALENPKPLKKINTNINFIPMRTKIITLWMLIIFGSIFHYIYGIMGILYFKEIFPIEIKEVGAPKVVHIFRFIMEGSAIVMVLLTLFLKNRGFRLIALIWAILLTIYNCFHVVEEIMGSPSNSSLIFILILTAISSVILSVSLYKWRKMD